MGTSGTGASSPRRCSTSRQYSPVSSTWTIVKTIEQVSRLAGLLGDQLQVRFSHIRAHVLQRVAALGPKTAEKSQQYLGLAMLADPQQAADSGG